MANVNSTAKIRKLIAISFGVIALVIGVILFLKVDTPEHFGVYFTKAYYGEFGAIAICVELLAAAYYLFIGHKKTNFAMALFAFTAVLDIAINLLGFATIAVPYLIMLAFLVCAIVAFYIAFSNAFNLGKISLVNVIFSFVLGNAIAFYFNYF